jgi:GNAT superfamily N-acetyltransferase
MTGKLVIRPVEAGDHDQWHALWTAYLAFYEATVADQVHASTWSRFFIDDRYEPNCFVAKQDGKLVGLVHFLQHRHNWRVENVIYLQDLYAVPESRGSGVGRALIEAVYAHGDAIGCQSVYWMTNENNETARKLYDHIAKLTPFVKYQRQG